MGLHELANGRQIILALNSGSHLYGTNLPESDLDVRGVVMPLASEILGLEKFDEKSTIHAGEEDVLLYGLPKFIHLLVKGNPNVHEWLWAREYTVISPLGKELVEARSMFLSKKVGLAGLGYLNGQTHKMHAGGSTRDLGAKRKAIVEQFGYDTKNASHAVRIAREIEELFELGVMNVYREDDREELIAIRTGRYSLKEVCDVLEAETADAVKAVERNRAQISDAPPLLFANEFLIKAQWNHLLKEKIKCPKDPEHGASSCLKTMMPE